jgi:hypothetical protein
MRLLILLMIQYFMQCIHRDNLNIVVVYLLVLENAVGRMLGLLQ